MSTSPAEVYTGSNPRNSVSTALWDAILVPRLHGLGRGRAQCTEPLRVLGQTTYREPRNVPNADKSLVTGLRWVDGLRPGWSALPAAESAPTGALTGAVRGRALATLLTRDFDLAGTAVQLEVDAEQADWLATLRPPAFGMGTARVFVAGHGSQSMVASYPTWHLRPAEGADL